MKSKSYLSITLLMLFLSSCYQDQLSELDKQRPDSISNPLLSGKFDNPSLFSKAYGGSQFEFFSAMEKSVDGGYVVSGNTNSNDGDVSGNHGLNDVWVYKIDKKGNIKWQRTLGGSGNDERSSLIATRDGGYLVAAVTTSNDGDVTGNHGGMDIWLVKLNASGGIVWQKTLGGSNDEGIGVSSIIETADRGYLLVGGTKSNDGDVSGHHGDDDAWLVKVNKVGNIVWQKTIGGSGFDRIFSMIATPDGGYLLTGDTKSTDGGVSYNRGGTDAWLVKVNATGNIQWQKTHGGSGYENGYLLTIAPDGGYLLLASTNSNNGDVSGNHGSNDVWVVRLSSTGNIIWQKTLGSSDFDMAYTMINTKDGYLIGAFTNGNDGDVSGNHGGFDAWLVLLDRRGNIVDQRTMGGTGDDNVVDILPVNGSSYIMGGITSSNDGDVKGNHGSFGSFDIWITEFKKLK